MKGPFLKIALILFLLSILPAGRICFGQEMKTEKVKFNMKALTEEGKDSPAGESAFSIDIVSPLSTRANIFQSTSADMDIIGQVNPAGEVSFVTVNSKMAELNDRDMFTYSVHLVPGDNYFRVVAGDMDKNMVEKEFTILYRPRVLSLAEKIEGNSRYFALIIGIDEYMDNSIPSLDNPVKDSEQVYNALLSNYTFDEENMHLLRNATRGDLIQALDVLAQEVGPDDNLLIFYAGHGWWDETANVGYWLPSDADSHVKTNWFRNSALVDYLKEINSRHTLLIADACFGGSIFKTRAAFPSREKAYEKLYELPSRKAMTSGTLTEVPDRSSFTRFLVERLNENTDTYTSSEQLFSSFRIAVINNSNALPLYGEIQYVGDEGCDFIFF